MFRNIVLSAAAAGIAVGLAATALQGVTTTPLILKAEVYEHQQTKASHDHSHSPGDVSSSALLPASPSHVHGAGADGAATQVNESAAEEWSPADGLERTFYTAVANILMAFATSIMLLGAMVLRGGTIDARQGILWGIGGFAAASFLPAIGLPPELPGTEAADIIARQAWWLATMAASGVASRERANK